MKLTKRQYLYAICGIIVICCIGINTYRQNQRREVMRIEAHYKSIYGVEKKEQLAALQSMYDELVTIAKATSGERNALKSFATCLAIAITMDVIG